MFACPLLFLSLPWNLPSKLSRPSSSLCLLYAAAGIPNWKSAMLTLICNQCNDVSPVFHYGQDRRFGIPSYEMTCFVHLKLYNYFKAVLECNSLVRISTVIKLFHGNMDHPCGISMHTTSCRHQYTGWLKSAFPFICLPAGVHSYC